VNNTGFVVTGISLITLGIVGFIIAEYRFISPTPSNDYYHISQLAMVGITGMIVVGFGLAIISAAGMTKEKSSTDS
jgi:Co/Zn/Cd efflux system component